MAVFDFIGDLHGNFNNFKRLLLKLGYVFDEEKFLFKPPEERKIVILGDFINVGFQNNEILLCLKNMKEQNTAIIISGNHEYYLVLMYQKYYNHNKDKFYSLLQQKYYPIYVNFESEKTKLIEYIEWLKTIPLFYRNKNFVAVHAYWNDELLGLSSIKNISEAIDSSKNDLGLRELINKLLMGIYYTLENQESNKKIYYRFKWWKYKDSTDLKPLFYHNNELLPEWVEINPEEYRIKLNDDIVFFGHYNLSTFPYLTHSKKCCLDFGSAKNGFLASYCWNGEQELLPQKIIYV